MTSTAPLVIPSKILRACEYELLTPSRRCATTTPATNDYAELFDMRTREQSLRRTASDAEGGWLACSCSYCGCAGLLSGDKPVRRDSLTP